jgi:hypothetical protein
LRARSCSTASIVHPATGVVVDFINAPMSSFFTEKEATRDALLGAIGVPLDRRATIW